MWLNIRKTIIKENIKKTPAEKENTQRNIMWSGYGLNGRKMLYLRHL